MGDSLTQELSPIMRKLLQRVSRMRDNVERLLRLDGHIYAQVVLANVA